MTTTLRTTAHGKIMIAGEYAVLFGGPALIMCARQEASCTFMPGPTTVLRAKTTRDNNDISLLRIVMKTCKDAGLKECAGEYVVDTSAFYHPLFGHKMGLGSSAAATVALTKMVLLHNNITDRDLLLKLSLTSHDEFPAGLASGADVAAAAFGTTIQFAKGPLIEPLVPNHFLTSLIVVTTPNAQDTREYVRKAVAALDNDQAFLHKLVTESAKLCCALRHAQTEDEFISNIDRHTMLLAELGERADIIIETDSHKNIRRLAASCGGTAKPSGAGGGDIAIAYVPKLAREQFIAEVNKLPGCSALS